MNSLPVELLQLILDYCDPESVRALRLVTPTLADLGYDYLLPPSFRFLPWRDDFARLRAISCHDRLRSSIEAITFNATEIHVENARKTACGQTSIDLDVDQRTLLLTDAWRRFDEFEKLRRASSPLHTLEPADLGPVFRQLINLRHLAVSFMESPYDIDVVRRTLAVGTSAKMNYALACKLLNTLITALQQVAAERPEAELPSRRKGGGSDEGQDRVGREPGSLRLASFVVDRLPLELFRHPCDRSLWFQCDDLFSRLTRLDLTLDTSNVALPASRFKAVNGLGYVLRLAPRLTHLSLAFHNYTNTREKFPLSFRELFGESAAVGSGRGGLQFGKNGSHIRAYGHGRGVADEGFCYTALADLRLDGIYCDERELRTFLLRHAATLEYLHLGGKGVAQRPYDSFMGGVMLSNGTFWSLFRNLRNHRLPRLRRMHLEGEFYCQLRTVSNGQYPPPDNADFGNGHVNSQAHGPTHSNDTNAASGIGGAGGNADANGVAHIAGYNRSGIPCERYWFRSEDGWMQKSPATARPGSTVQRLVSCRAFEQYVMGITDQYPGWYHV